MPFLDEHGRQQFASNNPQGKHADIWMIAGCEDHTTSADVSNVGSFQLPEDQGGGAGGACTAALLEVLYEDEQRPLEDYTFTQVLTKMRAILAKRRFKQVPQLSSTRPINLNEVFTLVPDTLPGHRRAILIGINYTGQKGALSGCHGDVFNMYNYIQDYHGFQDEDITVLIDDEDHARPTKAAMLHAYRDIVQKSQPGDAIFLQFSGHGTKVKDLNGDEDDGFDEALLPVDFRTAGLIIDDELHEIIVKGLPPGVHVVALVSSLFVRSYASSVEYFPLTLVRTQFDCCHSGTVLDLPYVFKADGSFRRMEIEDRFDPSKLNALLGKRPVKKMINKIAGGKAGGKMVQGFLKHML